MRLGTDNFPHDVRTCLCTLYLISHHVCNCGFMPGTHSAHSQSMTTHNLLQRRQGWYPFHSFLMLWRQRSLQYFAAFARMQVAMHYALSSFSKFSPRLGQKLDDNFGFNLFSRQKYFSMLRLFFLLSGIKLNSWLVRLWCRRSKMIGVFPRRVHLPPWQSWRKTLQSSG